ncbi:hypothetical protein JNUCC1_02758 [Lentibacillus sp. JNUCC-1]|uniref:hypothetical protein n=1 Tax=Lentibacillus sp. JNUCC-1 TaxID=2654513 RepID=UPI0012E8D956|nr:hypothetical protein [Lentibacillus sp. JNUCC-1]MUV38886.1 hypothetical protein [Lentibacillus sp. JNUCC-1]
MKTMNTILLILIVAAGIFYLYQHREVPFENVWNDALDKNEQIPGDEELRHISIYYIKKADNERGFTEKHLKIDDKQMVNEVMDQALGMTVKKARGISLDFDGLYIMDVKTNHAKYGIEFDEQGHMQVEGKYYEIEGENRLLKSLKPMDWEPR